MSIQLQTTLDPKRHVLSLEAQIEDIETSSLHMTQQAVEIPSTAAGGESVRAGIGPLATPPGLEAVASQLEDMVAVLQAERQRRRAGLVVKRPAWKNLVFAGGSGTGKSLLASAIGPLYGELGSLSHGHVDEVAADDLIGATVAETGTLIAEAVRRASGGVLVITGAHSWLGLPDRGRHALRQLYGKLTEYRKELRDDVAIILCGEAELLRELLGQNPQLASRFRAFVTFPGYTSGQLADIFSALAAEAGLTLTPVTASKAAAILASVGGEHDGGSARLAVRLLELVTTAQARRVMNMPQPQDIATLCAVTEADIPTGISGDTEFLDVDHTGRQYL